MLYEMRTYSVKVGKMAEALKLYSEEGYPALEAGGHAMRLGGYMVSDTGPLHQLVHVWRFKDDAERRAHWKGVYADSDFMAFAGKLRPLLDAQEVRLLSNAPFGPEL
ncbi:MAG: NIPSNAP family protein [Albimonas sp.]|uniref:NIPSNAP family protein n=1 Tax=Albimonas sp. TaxID=1872425 RepID=UPI0040575143